MIRPSSSKSGVYIPSLLNSDPLNLGFKLLSLLDMSLICSIMICASILDYSLELPMAAKYQALSSI